MSEPQDGLADVRIARSEHNLLPDDAVTSVAAALPGHLDAAGLEWALPPLPAAARRYWQSKAVQPAGH